MKCGWRVGILYNEPLSSGQEFSESSQDVLAQVEAIEQSLSELDYYFVRIPFTKDLSAFIRQVRQTRVNVAINLCETVDEDARLAGHPAAVLELMQIPFSGSSSLALMLTTDKLLTKQVLKGMGIETPKHIVSEGSIPDDVKDFRFPVIVKPRFEDASIGIDQESVFENQADLFKSIPEWTRQFGSVFIEEFIHGREFNVALMGASVPKVLPIAEIDFTELPSDLYGIVGYRAKWDPDSFEYHHTPRVFPKDLPLSMVKQLSDTALACFETCALRDYARVDFRVDREGKIYVLEVNANPCLSPDAGFAAAIRQSGITYSEMVEVLIDNVCRRAKEDGKAVVLSGQA